MSEEHNPDAHGDAVAKGNLRVFAKETILNLEMLSQDMSRVLARARELFAELDSPEN